ncbi:hypothetical protein CBS101457_001471 [Exobasidium rhododendri]|nr:hypothetical protein CBS101457_001471 [Exobasidium rhododendri]
MSWRSNQQKTGENALPLGNSRRWGGGGGGPAPTQGGGGPGQGMYGGGGPPGGGMGAMMGGGGGGGGGYNFGQSQGSTNNSFRPSYSSSNVDDASDPISRAIKREREENDAEVAATEARNREIAAAAAAANANVDGSGKCMEDTETCPCQLTHTVHHSTAPRKRKSRWGDEKVDPGVATAIGSNVTPAELERYALNVRLDEIAKKLRTGDFVPPERERSPSPPPTYDSQGRRTNTREVRYKKRLEDERVRLVDKQIKLDPSYRPPAEYAAAKRNSKPQEKVYLPIKEFPEINFFGLLVGPRGNSLKKMEKESGAKISIRGRGSVKEGKGRMGDEEEEEMHCVVAADDETKVKRCVKLINLVIETAASTPEAQNDHKRNQLRELAALNGTLRDDENQVCQNCGEKGHRKFECPEQRNWTAHIVCHRCGQQGHLARDCTQGGPGSGRPGGPPGLAGGGMQGGAGNGNGQDGSPFDSEYANLMAELGEGGKNGPGSAGPATDRPLGPDGKKIPPWRDPAMWNAPTIPAPRQQRFGMGGFQGGQFQQQQSQQQWGGQQGGYDYQQGGQQGYDQHQQSGAQPDYREAWIQYYVSQGMDPAAAATAAAAAAAGTGQDQQQQQQQPQAQPQQVQSQAGQSQQDYSKEWEEYYRQQAAAGQPVATAAAAATVVGYQS